MIRFSFLEDLGVRLAAITERVDGDCSRHAGNAGQANRAAVCAMAGMEPSSLVCGEQVHGTNVAAVSGRDAGRGFDAGLARLENTDGLTTNAQGVTLAVFVADCVPVYLYDPANKAVALIHAGREGSRARIAQSAVEMMKEHYDSRSRGLYALIGPSIGPCCYQVSEEMAARCAGEGWPVKNQRLDLWEMNRAQLIQAGIPGANIFDCRICTVCSGRFHSYRRDDDRCRNLALIAL